MVVRPVGALPGTVEAALHRALADPLLLTVQVVAVVDLVVAQVPMQVFQIAAAAETAGQMDLQAQTDKRAQSSFDMGIAHPQFPQAPYHLQA